MKHDYCSFQFLAVRLFCQEVKYASQGKSRGVGTATKESGCCRSSRGSSGSRISNFRHLSRDTVQMGRQISQEPRFSESLTDQRQAITTFSGAKGSVGWTVAGGCHSSWMEQRSLDMPSRNRAHSAAFSSHLQSRSCISPCHRKAGLVIPTTREDGSRTECREGQDLAFRRTSRDQKKAETDKATLIFLDEVCFQLMPTRRRTLSPRGKTPVLPAWDRRDKISTIRAITLSPKAKREGFLFKMLPANQNFDACLVIDFLRQIGRKIPGNIKLIWDRAGIHTAKIVNEFIAAHPRLETFNFLPYTPDTNPVEGCCGHAKYHQMPNLLVRDVAELRQHAVSSLNTIKSDKSLLRAFIEHAHHCSEASRVC